MLEENPIPRFQNLTLMQLPKEILDHIMSFVASDERLHLFERTCRALYEVAARHKFSVRVW